MAALNALVQAKFPQEKDQNKNGKHFRLVADPTITVSQVARCFQSFLEYKGTTCLWSQICPPPAGPLSYTWQTPPHAPWLVKTSGLLFELTSIAPNTKLLQMVVQKSLRVLIGDKVISVPDGKKAEDLVDKMDTTVRILLNMAKDPWQCVLSFGGACEGGQEFGGPVQDQKGDH